MAGDFSINKEIFTTNLIITNKCNLFCKYCYSNDENIKTIKKSDLIKSLDIIINSPGKIKVINILGGEPLIEMNLIKDIVKYSKTICSDKEVHFTLSSNGTLLDKEKCAFIKKNNIYLGISLDGDKKTHDANRIDKSGSGTHDIILKKLKYLSKDYIKKYLRISMTLTPKNIPSLLENFYYLSKITKDIKINPVFFTHWTEEDYYSFIKKFYLIEKYKWRHKVKETVVDPPKKRSECLFYENLSFNYDGNIYVSCPFINNKCINNEKLLIGSIGKFPKKYLTCKYDQHNKRCQTCGYCHNVCCYHDLNSNRLKKEEAILYKKILKIIPKIIQNVQKKKEDKFCKYIVD